MIANRRLICAVIIFLFGLLPFAVGPHSLHIVILALISLIVATAWNILIWTHQISLGHAGFFGLGAYAAAVLYDKGLTIIPVNIFIGGLAAALTAVIIGLVCCKMAVWAMAIVTLAFAEVLRILVIMLPDLTYGAEGIKAPPMFGGGDLEKTGCFYAIFFVVLLALFSAYALKKSKLYYAFLAVHDDEEAANMLGVNTVKYKVIAFAISAFFTGLAGGLFVHYISFIDPYTAFGLHISVDAQIMPLVGGIYTIIGPVFGAFLITILGESLRIHFGHGYLIVYGCLLIAFILFLPDGIMGLVKKLERKISHAVS